jgi:hypothetical protein
MDEPDVIFAVLGRVGLFGFWFFDNLQILSQIKFLKFDPEKFKKPAMSFWLISLVLNLINCFRNLKNAINDNKG